MVLLVDMTFLLCPAKASHVATIARIWRNGWHDAHAEIVPSELRARRTDQSFATRAAKHVENTEVALIDTQIVGFCMTQADELYQMYVTAHARGTGVAGALIQSAEARIQGAGHKQAWLACAVGNDRAGRFYEKSGWINSSTEPVELETAEGPFFLDVWRFTKALK